MESVIKDFLVILVLFVMLPAIYIVVFIKLISKLLDIENTLLKILLFLGMILSLPLIVYIHMILLYAAGGGH